MARARASTSTSTSTNLLEEERTRSSIRSFNLSHLLYGGRDTFHRWRIIADIFEQDPVFDKTEAVFMNHTQRYINACKKVVRYRELIEELGLSPQEIQWAYTAIDGILPIDVHQAMFLPCIMYQTSPEQRDMWLDDALTLRIMGAYAQTELGHGSNVRGIETTSTYDKETKEFVLHSPTLTSTKWWPGGLGHTATHCIAHARLIIDDTDYGIHAFLVQLRSLENHIPLKGITLGDIGPKVGFNEIDNGFCRFDRVRIPRQQMLMGSAQVSENGIYEKKSGAEKMIYGAMLQVRVNVVGRASIALARALTIAIRYSAVRCQGYEDGTMKERAVLDYPTQQAVLLPLIAWAYALHFTGARMLDSFTEYINSFDTNLLPELHATSSGLKATITYKVADGIEACRKMCGGHGFSQFSALPELSNNYLAICTLEGTKEVLEPQCARFLFKCLAGESKGAKRQLLSPEVEYLSRSADLLNFRCSITSHSELVNANAEQMMLALFEARSVHALKHAQDTCNQIERQGLSSNESFVAAGVEVGLASRAHSHVCMLQAFISCLQKCAEQRDDNGIETDADDLVGAIELSVLRQLLQLFALSTIEDHMGEFRDNDILSSEQARMVSTAVRNLNSAIRVHAVPLVEAWAMSDTFLNSALGGRHGDVYEELYRLALREPLNSSQVSRGYDHLRKLIGRARL